MIIDTYIRSDGGFNGARRDLLAIGLIQVNALVLGVGFFVDPWGSVPVSTFEPSLRVPIHRTYHWQDIHRRPSYLMLRWIRPWFSRLGGGWYDGRTAGQQLRARLRQALRPTKLDIDCRFAVLYLSRLG